MYLAATYTGGDSLPDTPIEATFRAALESVAPTVTTKIGEQAMPGESWVDTLQRLMPILATTVQQRQILNAQMERARQGLPPLDATQYGVGVSVGLSPETQRMLMFAALGIGGVLLFMALRKRR
jgi:hypothetical protein